MIELQKLLPNIKQNEPMSKHTTFKIGGPARYFCEVRTKNEIIEALKAAEKASVQYFILGGGSNLLVSDKGYDGLVIKQLDNKYSIDGENVFAESGVLLQELLEATLDAGLVGWAWAAGLPGTVGGAVRGNAGAYGEAMSDIITSVELYKNGEVVTFNPEQMKFSYRHSIVKEEKYVVLSVNLRLKKGDTTEDKKLVDKYNEYRRQTQPLDMPNSGCVFKNVDLKTHTVEKEKILKVLDITEEEYARATKHNKLPVSFIFDKMDLKGKQIGGAKISEKHGAFIVNTGTATSEHVIMLMSELKMKIRNQLGIMLEEEIQYVGFE